MEKEKFFGESLLKEEQKKKLNLILKDKAVQRKHLSDDVSAIFGTVEELQRQVKELSKLLQGIVLTATPEYFIGTQGCLVHIIVRSTMGMKMDHLALYKDGVMLTEASQVDAFEYNVSIDDTAAFTCNASIGGVEYMSSKTVKHYESFCIGAGTSYSEAMTDGNWYPIMEEWKGSYSVTCKTGDNIFIILKQSEADKFVRADINGVEIPLVESTVSIDDVVYKVFASANQYQAGVYSISINS